MGTKILQRPLQGLPTVASRKEQCSIPSLPDSSVSEALSHFGFGQFIQQPWCTALRRYEKNLEGFCGKKQGKIATDFELHPQQKLHMCSSLLLYLLLSLMDHCMNNEGNWEEGIQHFVHQAGEEFILYWVWEESHSAEFGSTLLGRLSNYCSIQRKMCNSNMTLPKVIWKLKASEECDDKATSGERKKKILWPGFCQDLDFRWLLKWWLVQNQH